MVVALDNSGSMKKNDPERLLPKVVLGFAGELPAEAVGRRLVDAVQPARLGSLPR